MLFCDRMETALTPGAGVTEQVTALAGSAMMNTEAVIAIMATAVAAPARLFTVVIAFLSLAASHGSRIDDRGRRPAITATSPVRGSGAPPSPRASDRAV
ncbi:hypothetical protein GCM10009530_59590 [Microbispora corallina]|uniref:Uncharacterized protein n=1 Tax=Microbispora corallina TaxID=83302 RepID=A0ABQ4GA50_9ACTN|nr:hypothetical protein Mco01_69660 [Microbispora corallina]